MCLEQLDQRCKVLPCQHTFCRRCLEAVVERKKELRCPECRVLVEGDVDDLPANIMLVRILEQLSPIKPSDSLEAKSNEKPSDQVKPYLLPNGFVFAIVFVFAVESLPDIFMC